MVRIDSTHQYDPSGYGVLLTVVKRSGPDSGSTVYPGEMAHRSSSPRTFECDSSKSCAGNPPGYASSCARNAAKPRKRSPDCGYSATYSGWNIDSRVAKSRLAMAF